MAKLSIAVRTPDDGCAARNSLMELGHRAAIVVYFARSRRLNGRRGRGQHAGTGSVVPAWQPADTVLVDGEAAVPG